MKYENIKNTAGAVLVFVMIGCARQDMSTLDLSGTRTVVLDSIGTGEDQDMMHAYPNHTQIKWNGVLGDMILKASHRDAPKDIQVYPTQDLKKIRVAFQQYGPVEGQVGITIKWMVSQFTG